MTLSKYTKEFLELDFSPYQHLANSITDSDSLIDNQVPMVEISGLDKNLLEQLYNFCLDNIETFQTPDTVLRSDTWYTQAHTYRWKQYAIRQGRPERLGSFISGINFVQDSTIPDDINGQAGQLVDQLFEPFGLHIRHARFGVLEPGGYFAPHVDVFEKDPGMCYFWIPLHNMQPNMKVFPWGWAIPTYGNMYMFNYSKYVHSVANNENNRRFILGAVLDINRVPESFMKLFRENKKNFQQLFKQIL